MPPIVTPDPRTRALRQFDRASLEFESSCRRRARAAGAVAERDIVALSGLADIVVADVELWRDHLETLDLASRGDLDVALTCTLICEWLGDEVLESEAAAVFNAAVDLAAQR